MTDTSQAAFASVQPSLNHLQEVVLQAIKDVEPLGLTASDVIETTSLLDYTARPRLTELRKAGLIYDTKTRRPNKRGNKEIVYRVSQPQTV